MAGPLPAGYGPGRRTIPIAAKLGVAVIIANLAGLLAAVWLPQQIRAVPASAGTETWLFVGYYTALAIVAIADALLLDELLFKGSFRLTALQGKDGSRLNLKDDEATVAATLQRPAMTFPVVLILCGAVTYLLFNVVNHDFNPYYKRVGKYVSQLRGDDPATQQQRNQAISALSIRRDDEITPVLLRQLGRGGETATWAAWALGRFVDARTDRKSIIAALWAASEETDQAVRLQALISLARLQHRAVATPLQAELRKQLDAGTVDRRLLYATGFIQVPSSLPLLAEALQRSDDKAQQIAAWAIAQHRDQREARDLDGMLEARLPSAGFLTRCAIIFSLGIIGDERSNLALMHAHDLATPEERTTMCPVQSLYLSPDGKEDPFDFLSPPDTYQLQILNVMAQMRATSPEIREKVEPWLEALVAANKADTESLLASRARSLLDGIRSGRDDTRARTPADLAPAPAP